MSLYEPTSRGIAEQGCAEAELSKAGSGNGIDLICEEKLRNRYVGHILAMEQIKVKETNDGK